MQSPSFHTIDVYLRHESDISCGELIGSFSPTELQALLATVRNSEAYWLDFGDDASYKGWQWFIDDENTQQPVVELIYG